MKFFVLLLLLFTPVDVNSSNRSEYLLSCRDFDSILEGILRSDMETSIKGDLLEEIIISTDPKCFDS